jgi:hypothetical protein
MPHLELGLDRSRNTFKFFQLDGGFVGTKPLSEVQHPLVVLVEVGTTGQRAERNVLVDIGVARGVGHFFRLDARPGRRSDDLARLGLDVAESDLVFVAAFVQVAVVDTGFLG